MAKQSEPSMAMKRSGAPRYHYILWDVDGTLLDFRASEAHAVRALFKKYNLGTCTDEMLAEYSQINVKYWQKLERGEMTKPEILVGRFREFFANYGLDTSIVEAFNADYQPALGDHCVFIPNAWDVLQGQKASGDYTLAIITNGTKIAQTKKLRVTELDQVFEHIFISEDVGFEKPAAEFFDHVCAELGVTDRSKCLIIGDSLTGDIRGGANAGIDTCWFNPAKKPAPQDLPITYEIESLLEVTSILTGAL